MSENQKPHFYYEVNKESQTGQQLTEFMERCQVAEAEARKWVEKVGAKSYYESPEGMAGGISAVIFEEGHEPMGWSRVVSIGDENLFIPEEGSSLEKEMYALPVVMEFHLISILSLEPRVNSNGKKLPFTFGSTTPLLFSHRNKWLLDVPYPSESADCVSIDETSFSEQKISHIEELNLNFSES